MKAIVYIKRKRWDDLVVLSEKEFKAMKEEEIAKQVADEVAFHDWLSDNYSAGFVWGMNDQEKKRIEREWKEACEEDVNLNSGFEPYEIDM